MSIEAMTAKARKHWAMWLPERTRELKAAGEFEAATRAAAIMAQREMDLLMQQGFREHEAEEVVLAQYILLKPEPEAELEDWEREELAQRDREYRELMRGHE